MTLLDVVPAPLRVFVLVALVALGAASGAWVTDTWWQAKHAAFEKKASNQAAIAQAVARAEEQRRQAAIEEIRANAQKENDLVAADAAAADARADGLQRELARIKRAASSNTCAAAGGAPATITAELLADMLGELEQAGREIAAEADRRGVAGRACEASFAALTNLENQSR